MDPGRERAIARPASAKSGPASVQLHVLHVRRPGAARLPSAYARSPSSAPSTCRTRPRVLGQPPAGVGHALAAVGDVDADALALVHQQVAQRPADAEQHLVLVALGRRVVALGELAHGSTSRSSWVAAATVPPPASTSSETRTKLRRTSSGSS